MGGNFSNEKPNEVDEDRDTDENIEEFIAIVANMGTLIQGLSLDVGLSALAQLVALVICECIPGERDSLVLTFTADMRERLDHAIKSRVMDEMLDGEPAGHG
jgi:hypothetical protein